MLSPSSGGSVGSYLRLDTPSGQRLHVHRLVLEPVAVLVPERVLEPVRVVARLMIGAVVRATGLLSRLGGDHRGARRLDQVVELERFDPRGIEHAALVLDLGAAGAVGDFPDFLHALGEHVRKTEYAAMRLHGAANLHADLGDRLAV